jgi:hypothetical protein
MILGEEYAYISNASGPDANEAGIESLYNT